jgi:hypothetical protein
VPKLRSTDDPDLFMESAMALFACGVGNNDEHCLYELYGHANNATHLREALLKEHERIMVGKGDSNPDLQLSIWDSPDKPAIFYKETDKKTGLTTISLAGGDLFWSAWSSDSGSAWQGPNSHYKAAIAWPVTQLQVEVQETPAGPEIKNMTWMYTEQHIKIPGTG